eukprot:scaffold48056_cov29-Tisochrysis_lutea.AAC.4
MRNTIVKVVATIVASRLGWRRRMLVAANPSTRAEAESRGGIGPRRGLKRERDETWLRGEGGRATKGRARSER